MVSIVGFAATFYFFIIGTASDLPAGHYPVVMWVLPAAMVWGGFFLLAAFILEKLGIAIYRRDG